jgi:hypothetical protein
MLRIFAKLKNIYSFFQETDIYPSMDQTSPENDLPQLLRPPLAAFLYFP